MRSLANFFQFHAVFVKNLLNKRLFSQTQGLVPPPPPHPGRLGNPGSATANKYQVSPDENLDEAVVARPVRYIGREVELGEGEEDPEAWFVDVVVAVRHGFGARTKLTAITRHVRATLVCEI